jgi:hypothetical protein
VQEPLFRGLRNARRSQGVKSGKAKFDAGGDQGINELEDVKLEANEIGASGTATAIGISEVPDGEEVLGLWGEVAARAMARKRKDGAVMKLAFVATTGRLAALSLEGVERTGQERFTPLASIEQVAELLLGLEQFGAERTQKRIHDGVPGHL